MIRAHPLDGVVAARQLRQDHPRRADGRRQRRHPRDRRHRRPDAQRPLPRPQHRLGHGRLPQLHRGTAGRDPRPPRTSPRLEGSMSRSAGHCMTMGTASTMACLTEALGMPLPGGAAIPAVDARRVRARRGVRRPRRRHSPSDDLRPGADHDARGLRERHPHQRRHRRLHQRRRPPPRHRRTASECRSHSTTSTRLGRRTPAAHRHDARRAAFSWRTSAYAGGLPARHRRTPRRLHRDALTVTGRTLVDELRARSSTTARSSAPWTDPCSPPARGTAVLRGNLAPERRRHQARPPPTRSCSATPRPALVFDSLEDYLAVADDPDLRRHGRHRPHRPQHRPQGLPRHARGRQLPAPEEAAGRRRRATWSASPTPACAAPPSAPASCTSRPRPPSAARSPSYARGTYRTLDVPARRLDVLVEDAELERRRSEWQPPAPPADARLDLPLHPARHPGRHRRGPRLPGRRQRLRPAPPSVLRACHEY